MDERIALLDLLARDSFRLGEFKLASGATSDYYVDCRTTTLAAAGARLTGRLFLDELRRVTPAVEAVGGLTMGADPIVMSVVVQSAGTDSPINGFLVRKAEKTHGTGRRIEGVTRPGLRVAIVDDVCTTAGSTIQAIEVAWEAGLDVIAVMCLLEREEAGGRTNLDQLWRAHRGRPCPFQALFSAREVREAHKELLRAGNTIAEAAQ